MNNRTKEYVIDASAHLTITAADKAAIEKDLEEFAEEKNGAHFVMRDVLNRLREKRHKDKLIQQYIWELFPVSIASKKRNYSDLWKQVNK